MTVASQRPAPSDWELEQQEWIDALADVLDAQGGDQAKKLLARLQHELSHKGIVLTDAALNTPYRKHDRASRPAAVPRRHRTRKPHREHPAVECRRHGAAGLRQRLRRRRAHRHLPICFHHDGSGPESRLPFAVATPTAATRCTSRRTRRRESMPGRSSRAVSPNPNSSTFRRELADGGGLPSYPHPRRMPWFWQMPCASMGLSTPSAIYQARFAKYLEHRGLKKDNGGKIWAFIGRRRIRRARSPGDDPDCGARAARQHRPGGELQSAAARRPRARQRQDHPGTGTGVPRRGLARRQGDLGRRLGPLVRARRRRRAAGAHGCRRWTATTRCTRFRRAMCIREHWVENNPALRDLMSALTDEEVRAIKRGGHDHKKVYAAFKEAEEVAGKPCVVLLKTVKGDGLGPGAAGSNTVQSEEVLEARRAPGTCRAPGHSAVRRRRSRRRSSTDRPTIATRCAT